MESLTFKEFVIITLVGSMVTLKFMSWMRV